MAARVYDQASGLLEKKDYEAAVGLLTRLGDYADSAEKIKAAQEAAKKALEETKKKAETEAENAKRAAKAAESIDKRLQKLGLK